MPKVSTRSQKDSKLNASLPEEKPVLYVCKRLKTIHVENCGEYVWYFNSGVDPSALDKYNKLKIQNKIIPPALKNQITEHHGVAIVIHRSLIPYLMQVTAYSGRLIKAKFIASVPVNIICAYAPTAVDSERAKDDFSRKAMI